MKKITLLSLFVSGLSLFPYPAEAKDPIVIYIHLFQGIREEGQAGLNAIEILQAASRPELASIKANLSGPEAARTAAEFEALLEIFKLRAVDELFLHEADWNGKDAPVAGWILGKSISYRVGLSPSWNSSNRSPFTYPLIGQNPETRPSRREERRRLLFKI